MQRQIDMLVEANALEAIVTDDPGDNQHLYDHIPVISLRQQSLFRRVGRALSRRVGLAFFPLRTNFEMLETTLKSSRADTILCQYGTYAVSYMPVLSKAQHRVFIHVHGYDTYEQLCPKGYRENLIQLSNTSQIICNSLVTHSRMLKWGVHPNRLVTKYPGVKIPSSPIVRNPASEVTILHLGRLVDCKSPDRTIKAFELSCELGLQGQLIIAGDGPLRVLCELLKVRSKWGDRIKILGAISEEESAKLFAAADIFTLHSIKGELTGQVEAFGVSIIEAMSASLPVVSCNIGGIKEIVIDKKTGFLIEPGDIKAQAEKLILLAQNPKLQKEMGEEGWLRAKVNFSWEKEKSSLLNILGLKS